MRHDPNLVAAILRRDFYSFAQAAFPILVPGVPFVPNWHLEAIAFALTQVMEGKILRLIITVPPRSLKSILASVAFPAFVLGQDPTLRFICVSYAEALARAHADDTRRLMRSDMYGRVFPATGISLLKDTALEFATMRGGYRLATSVGGTLTGRGGNFVIIDDPMKPQEACSEAARDSAKQWYSNTLMTRLDDKTQGAIVVVMQRLHVDDLVGYLVEQGGWHHLNLPAIAEVESQIPLSATKVHLRRVGDLLHPEREPREVLEELKRSMGSLDFAAQYQQEPVAEGGNLIKWKWFQFYDAPPRPQPGDRIVVSWDTALSVKDLASYSVCVVLLVRNETIYVMDVRRERLEYPELRRAVGEVHGRWRRAANNYSLLIENKGSGMALLQHLKRDGIRAIAVDPHGEKAMRMNAQTARIEAGAVFLPRSASWLEEFRREILAFPAGRHNDQVDALSQGLNRAFEPIRRYGTFTVGGY